MAGIYFKIREEDVPGFQARMRALGITRPVDLIDGALLAGDEKNLKAKLAENPDDASEDLKAACTLTPLHVQQVSVMPLGAPTKDIQTNLRVMRRPRPLAEKKLA